MKLIAHRGWCAGAEENTLAALARAVADPRLSGVEFDVCRARVPVSAAPHEARDVSAAWVSHDAPRGENCLTLDAALSFLEQTDLALFVEIKESDLAPAVIQGLVSRHMAERAVVFGFASVAKPFPWRGPRPVRLGVIVRTPWNLDRVLRACAPDVLLLGWDERAWTRRAFRAWWSVFSLARLTRRCRVPVVIGVVRRRADLDWLSRQEVYAAVADMDCL